MDDGNTPFEAPEGVPEPEVTATPETVVEEQPVADAAEPEETKTFTQEELDAIVGKRLAKEQRKWEREQARRAPEQTPAVNPQPVAPEQFETYEEYAEALAEQKVVEKMAQREAQQQQKALLDQYHALEDGARDKYDDFDQVAYNPNLPVTEHMALSIQSSDAGPDLLYWLGSNPKEADRIARLHPILQAKEIGKIEATLASEPPVRKTTTAPAPIAPVTARSSTGKNRYDTTDPRSVDSMSTSEWIEAERQRQLKRAQGRA